MKRILTLTALLLAPLAVLNAADQAAADAGKGSLAAGEGHLAVTDLRCEYLVDPLGIDVEKPRLNWVMEEKAEGGNLKPERAIRQTAYQVLVASALELLAKDQGDLWDSGRVASDQSVFVEYAGKALAPRTNCYWKVRVWDQAGAATEWSQPASWTMGVMGDWKASWIASRDVPMRRPAGQKFTPAKAPPGNFNGNASARREAVMMRKDVKLAAKPERAVARVTALGFVELMINGRKAGDRVMAPALADNTKRVYYDVSDVTGLLQAGDNTLGAILANGFFACPGRGWGSWSGVGNEPVLSVEVECVMPDGTHNLLTSDQSWKWSTGEIVFNDFFVGEHHDLRLAQPGWNKPGFKDDQWQPVVAVAAPPGKLEANPGTPVRVTEVVKPVRKEGNKYILDAMFTGWPRIEVTGKDGQQVSFGDNGKPRGGGRKWNPKGDSADFKFTLKGGGPEVLEPRFMVHTIGPVIDITGIDPPPPIEAVTIKRAGAALRPTGKFACSNDFLNHVYDAVVRTHRNYTLDIPMDPTREKAGWSQDVQTMMDSTVYMTDMGPLYRRWWIDMVDSQTPNGAAGSVIPMIWGGQEHCWDDPWWSGMIIYLPFKHYQYYGDKQMLMQAYPSMKAYLEWLGAKADKKDGLMRWSGASDWIEVGIDGWGPPKRTPTFVVSTCAWYLYATMVAQTARIAGKPDEAVKYQQLAGKIKDNFNARCLDADTGLYGGANDSQTALILPLALSMVPDDKRELVIKRLVENIGKWKGHLNTGFVGTPYLMEGLAEIGLAETSYQMVTQQDYPGWQTLITDGVMKETWRGGLAQMPSLGGSVGQWFYKVAAGIRPDPTGPGFKKIIIKPSIIGDLTWVKCGYDSIHGHIGSNWQRERNKLTMEVAIPPNTTATIYVSAKDATAVTESGQPAAKAQGVKWLRMENHAAVYEIGSGTYRFQSALPECPP